jgi:hypothetical protein
MTEKERKDRIDIFLKQFNITYNNKYPISDTTKTRVIRDAADIAKRILILTYLNVYSEDGRKDIIIRFLKSEELWDALSNGEKILLEKDLLSDKDKIDLSWHSEVIYLMLWAINKIETLSLPTEQCEIREMLKLLPPYFKSTKEFVQKATTRSTKEISDMADFIDKLYWAIRQEELGEGEIPFEIDSNILEERYYGINWITFPEDNWDDITMNK